VFDARGIEVKPGTIVITARSQLDDQHIFCVLVRNAPVATPRIAPFPLTERVECIRRRTLAAHKALNSFDLPPASRTSVIFRKSVNQENDGHEEEQIHRRTNHRVHQPGRGRRADQGAVPQGRFSDATFYKWRAKFGGMGVPDAKRLRELEGENAKLKKLLAEAHLDMHALKSALGVKR
jgi:hypothetical protein